MTMMPRHMEKKIHSDQHVLKSAKRAVATGTHTHTCCRQLSADVTLLVLSCGRWGQAQAYGADYQAPGLKDYICGCPALSFDGCFIAFCLCTNATRSSRLVHAQGGVEQEVYFMHSTCCKVKGGSKLQMAGVASHEQCRFLAFHQHQTDQYHTCGFLCPRLTALLKLQSVYRQSRACYPAQACCAIVNHQPADPNLLIVICQGLQWSCQTYNGWALKLPAMSDHRAIILDGLGEVFPEQKLLASIRKAETCHHAIFCVL